MDTALMDTTLSDLVLPCDSTEGVGTKKSGEGSYGLTTEELVKDLALPWKAQEAIYYTAGKPQPMDNIERDVRFITEGLSSFTLANPSKQGLECSVYSVTDTTIYFPTIGTTGTCALTGGSNATFMSVQYGEPIVWVLNSANATLTKHINDTTIDTVRNNGKNVHGATVEPTGNKLIIRDDNGEAKVKYSPPEGIIRPRDLTLRNLGDKSDTIANLYATVDIASDMVAAHEELGGDDNVHGATEKPTNNTIIARDGNGGAQVKVLADDAEGAGDRDIVNRKYVSDKFLPLAGGSMGGAIIYTQPPTTNPYELVNKGYVDKHVSSSVNAIYKDGTLYIGGVTLERQLQS